MVVAERVGYAATKRTFDLIAGSLLLMLATPFILMLAIAIRIDSPGPAVFSQERIGRGGRRFVFHKFRTMWIDARERLPELYTYRFTADEIERMYFKHADDPRLTRFGRVLRRTSLDELPNLINVVKGDMSLVGPRPEIPEMVTYYHDDQLQKFWVKPGVTGLAQINGRNILRFQQTIAFDLEYVAGRSLLLDLKILAKTPLVVFRMWGAL
jgi:lipopolysaccharide/colanic/teichoic acid biosynthesis glycosyltransferase